MGGHGWDGGFKVCRGLKPFTRHDCTLGRHLGTTYEDSDHTIVTGVRGF